MMRFYNQQHRFYCGVDLHARSLYVHVCDPAGTPRLHADDRRTLARGVDARRIGPR
jgi:hypothetical protein